MCLPFRRASPPYIRAMRSLRIAVDNRLRVESLPDLIRAELKLAFRHTNPNRIKLERQIVTLQRSATPALRKRGYALAHQLEAEPVYLETWREDEQGLSLPRGGLDRAREVLWPHGYDLEVVDRRSLGDPRMRVEQRTELPLWDFQKEVVAAVLEHEQGIVRSPTGSGKSRALMAAILAAGLPALIVVSTGNLFDQWSRRLQTDLGLRFEEVGMVGQGKFRIRPITVGMQQTLRQPMVRERLAPLFGFLGVDEVHQAGSPCFLEVVDYFPAKYRIGVSDSEQRKDRREFLLYDLFGEPIADVERDDLVDQGFILDVEVRLVPTDFHLPWWEQMPEQERALRWTDMLRELGRDESRNSLIVRLTEQCKPEQVVVFCHHEEHCCVIASAVSAIGYGTPDYRPAGLLVARLKKEFQIGLKGLLDRSIRVAAGTYQAVGTALDIPKVSCGVAATPIHRNKQSCRQVSGRLCRISEGKAPPVLYVPWDKYLFGVAPVKAWAQWSRTVRVWSGTEWVDAKQYLASRG